MKVLEYDRLARTACRGRSAEVDRLSDVSDLPVWHTTGIIIRTQRSLGSFVSLCGTLHQTFDTSLSCITPFTKYGQSVSYCLPTCGYKNKYSPYLHNVKWYSRVLHRRHHTNPRLFGFVRIPVRDTPPNLRYVLVMHNPLHEIRLIHLVLSTYLWLQNKCSPYLYHVKWQS